MTNASGAQPTHTSPVVPTMWGGSLLTLAVLVFVALDQTTLHGMADHVREHYAPHGTVPDPGLLHTYLYVTGAVGLLTWLLLMPSARARQGWVPGVATLVLLVATCGGVFNLLISEYGGPVLPPMWGVLTLLPCAVGAVTVALLWKDRAKTVRQ